MNSISFVLVSFIKKDVNLPKFEPEILNQVKGTASTNRLKKITPLVYLFYKRITVSLLLINPLHANA